MTTLDIQRRLKALGHDPGPLDGVRGRLTIAAIRSFQASCGLVPDGLVGPKTAAKLFPERASLPAAALVPQLRPWHAEAVRLLGTREGRGKADNPRILRWAEALHIGFRHDATAWCGLFVAHCIAASLPDEPLPTNPLAARNWLAFGQRCEPGMGAVLVFWRGSRTGWQGHVGFYAGEDRDAFHVLGGNQSDAVSIARIARTRLIGARWPRTAASPSGARAARQSADPLSVDEA